MTMCADAWSPIAHWLDRQLGHLLTSPLNMLSDPMIR